MHVFIRIFSAFNLYQKTDTGLGCLYLTEVWKKAV